MGISWCLNGSMPRGWTTGVIAVSKRWVAKEWRECGGDFLDRPAWAATILRPSGWPRGQGVEFLAGKR